MDKLGYDILELTDGFVRGKIDLEDMSELYHDITDEIENTDLEKALVGLSEDGQEDVPQIRTSRIHWLKKCKGVKRLLRNLVVEINDEFFHQDISRKPPDYQYTLYSDPYDHYDWHQDQYDGEWEPDFQRTLSLSLCLTPADFYEGAELFLRDGDPLNVRVFKLAFGEFVIFPATVEHRVNALRRGERASLVIWYGKEPD